MTVRRRCVCTSAMRFAQTVGLFVRYGARAFRIAPVRLFGFVRLNIYSGENAHRECKVQRNIAWPHFNGREIQRRRPIRCANEC